jgi:hypothetical protein
LYNNLLYGVKHRILDEVESAFLNHPRFSEKTLIYNKFPYEQRPQYGIILSNSSASQIRMSASNFLNVQHSYVRLAKFENYPGLGIEWVRENQDYLAVEFCDNLTSQITSVPQRKFNTTYQFCRGKMDLTLARAPSEVQIKVNGHHIEAEFVDGYKQFIVLPIALSSGDTLTVTYWQSQMSHPGVYNVIFNNDNSFIINPTLFITNEVLVNKTTGLETTVVFDHVPIGPTGPWTGPYPSFSGYSGPYPSTPITVDINIDVQALAVSPFILSGQNTVIAGTTNDIYYSTSSGTTWTFGFSNPLPSEILTLSCTGPQISTTSQLAETFLFAGTTTGLSIGNGIQWIASDFFSNLEVPAIATDSSTGNVYVVASNGRSAWFNGGTFTTQSTVTSLGSEDMIAFTCLATLNGNLYAGTEGSGVQVSSNAGTNWSSMNTGLTNLNISCITAMPGTGPYPCLYVGTSTGIFLSTDGTTWNSYSTGLVDADVQCLVSGNGVILAGTPTGAYILSGGVWTAINSGLTNTNIQCLTINISNGNVFAGTDTGVFFSNNYGYGWVSVPVTIKYGGVNNSFSGYSSYSGYSGYEPPGSEQIFVKSLYKGGYSYLLKRGIDYSMDYPTGTLTFLNPLEPGLQIVADYATSLPPTSSYPFKPYQENHTAIPGVVLSIGRRARAGDQQLVFITPTREKQADIYGGHWDMALSLSVISKDTVQLEEMTDQIVNWLWGVRKNQLEFEGITLNSVEPTGESEESFDDLSGTMYYEQSVDISVMTEWQRFIPYNFTVKYFGLHIRAVPDIRPVMKIPIVGYSKI